MYATKQKIVKALIWEIFRGRFDITRLNYDLDSITLPNVAYFTVEK